MKDVFQFNSSSGPVNQGNGQPRSNTPPSKSSQPIKNKKRKKTLYNDGPYEPKKAKANNSSPSHAEPKRRQLKRNDNAAQRPVDLTKCGPRQLKQADKEKGTTSDPTQVKNKWMKKSGFDSRKAKTPGIMDIIKQVQLNKKLQTKLETISPASSNKQMVSTSFSSASKKSKKTLQAPMDQIAMLLGSKPTDATK